GRCRQRELERAPGVLHVLVDESDAFGAIENSEPVALVLDERRLGADPLEAQVRKQRRCGIDRVADSPQGFGAGAGLATLTRHTSPALSPGGSSISAASATIVRAIGSSSGATLVTEPFTNIPGPPSSIAISIGVSGVTLST